MTLPAFSFEDAATTAGIQTLAALGLFVQVRSGQLSVASGALAAVGALAAAKCSAAGVAFPLCLLAGAIAGATVGLIASGLLFRLRALPFALGTLAVAEILRVAATAWPWAGASLGITDVRLLTNLAWAWGMALPAFLWLARHKRSSLGLRWDGLASSPAAVETAGIEPVLNRCAAFVTGSLLLGLSGGIGIHYVGTMPPSAYGIEAGLEVLLAVQIFGAASATSVVAGACLTAALVQVLAPFGEWRVVAYATLLLLLTVLRTAGSRRVGRHRYPQLLKR